MNEKREMKSFRPDENEIDAKLYENIVDASALERWRLEQAGQYFFDVDA